jgi:hypothetical protein
VVILIQQRKGKRGEYERFRKGKYRRGREEVRKENGKIERKGKNKRGSTSLVKASLKNKEWDLYRHLLEHI